MSEGGHGDAANTEIVMSAPVSVHADYFRQGIGTDMLTMGIEKVKEMGLHTVLYMCREIGYDGIKTVKGYCRN